jgi:hypothetical protein
MPSSYQVVLWKQESFVVLRPLQVEFFRNLLGRINDEIEGISVLNAVVRVSGVKEKNSPHGSIEPG